LQQKERTDTETISKEGANGAQTAQEGGDFQAQLAAAHTRAEALRVHFNRLQEQHKHDKSALFQQLIRSERDREAAESAVEHARLRAEKLTIQSEQDRSAREEAQKELAYLRAEMGRRDDSFDAAQELEQQRQHIAELVRQLNATRDELRTAWALNDQLKMEETAPAVPSSINEPIPLPLEGSAARAVLENIRQTLKSAEGSPNPGEILQLLNNKVADFAQRSLCAGSMAAHRIAGVCREIVQALVKTPSRMEALSAPLYDAFTLLGDVAECTAPSVHADTTQATVYVVDDDLQNCECIALALDKHGLCTHYASNPTMAIEHLAATPCELILLDVDLGYMSGFDVHAQLRQVPHHMDTPILFVSALSSAQERVAQLPPDKHAFVAKPYTLALLGLRTLSMVVGSRLAKAAAATPA